APRPVTLTSIALPALIILQDGAVTGTVNLSGGAAANSTITVSSSVPIVSISPASIPLAAGALSATFTVAPLRIGTTQITASMSGSTVSRQLIVRNKIGKEGGKEQRAKRELFDNVNFEDSPIRRTTFDGTHLLVGPAVARTSGGSNDGAIERPF